MQIRLSFKTRSESVRSKQTSTEDRRFSVGHEEECVCCGICSSDAFAPFSHAKLNSLSFPI